MPPGEISVSGGAVWSAEPSALPHRIEAPLINSGGEVWFGGFAFASDYTQTSGQTKLGSGLSSISGALSVTGGTFDLMTGTLSVTGNVAFGGQATLAVGFETAGSGALIVTGANSTLTLGGTLALAPTYNIPLGTRFTTLQAAQPIQGLFVGITGTELPNGSDFLLADTSDPRKFELVVTPE